MSKRYVIPHSTEGGGEPGGTTDSHNLRIPETREREEELHLAQKQPPPTIEQVINPSDKVMLLEAQLTYCSSLIRSTTAVLALYLAATLAQRLLS
ncbi:unnamed protein product [Sphagnum tenellum]